MTRIHRLDSRTIDRIAAGEVVARPASVVKELVENALDAGASRVDVEIEQGGVASIRVRDDGTGMSREDAMLAVERHATSKIQSEEDLARVATFGFRGEALPSIAAVSEFRLTTSDGASAEATRVEISFGSTARARPAAHPRGTEIAASRLFEKVPARRKFLKSAAAEAREVARVVTRAALANSPVAFRLVADGDTVVDLPAAASRAARVAQLFGDETGELVPFEARSANLSLSGFVSRGSVTFASRRLQFLFVNGRPVEDRTLSRALRDGAREAIRTDRHPAAFLFLTSPGGGVDVNVSPAKTEVRFAQPAEAYRLVYHGLVSALVSGKEERRLVPVPKRDFSVAEAREIYAVPSLPKGEAASTIIVGTPEGPGTVSPPVSEEPPVEPPRLLAQHDESFIVAEDEHGLLVIDQHAAHERVIYEKIRERVVLGRAFAQALLVPAAFEAAPEEALRLREDRALLSEMGLDIEELSGGSFSIRALPADASSRDPREFLRSVLDALAEGPRELEKRRDRLAATVACRSAVTIHHALAREELERLLSDWSRCRDRFTCPHGRPVVLSLSGQDLSKFFERK